MENVTNCPNDLTKDKKDKCILCGSDTGYTYHTPITQRQFYIEGAGQLCSYCYYANHAKNSR